MLKVRKDVFLDMREDLARRGVHEPAPPDTDEDEFAYGQSAGWSGSDGRVAQ
jgi:hypothetical protein